MKLPFTFMKLEVVFTLAATAAYLVAWIVVLAGFGWCAGANVSGSVCDARVAAGVRTQLSHLLSIKLKIGFFGLVLWCI